MNTDPKSATRTPHATAHHPHA